MPGSPDPGQPLMCCGPGGRATVNVSFGRTTAIAVLGLVVSAGTAAAQIDFLRRVDGGPLDGQHRKPVGRRLGRAAAQSGRPGPRRRVGRLDSEPSGIPVPAARLVLHLPRPDAAPHHEGSRSVHPRGRRLPARVAPVHQHAGVSRRPRRAAGGSQPHVGRVFHRHVGRRHAADHHDAPERGLHPPQRRDGQRSGQGHHASGFAAATS